FAVLISSPPSSCSLLSPSSSAPLALHSFPTRRSSDLHFFHFSGGVFLFLFCFLLVVFAFRRRFLLFTRFLFFLLFKFFCGFFHTDRKSTRLNSSHVKISYAVFCFKKKISSSALCNVHG